MIVPPDRFTLKSGEESLTEYRFDSGVAKHLFYKFCGIKSFYIPRSHPDGVSVNARCLDPGTIEDMNVKPFDGKIGSDTTQKVKPKDFPTSSRERLSRHSKPGVPRRPAAGAITQNLFLKFSSGHIPITTRDLAHRCCCISFRVLYES